MSFPDDEFGQNLIKSIESLLEEKSLQLVEHFQDDAVSGAADVWPTVVPKYVEGNYMLIDGQRYVKWSTVDSDERPWSKKSQIPMALNMNNNAAASSNIGGPAVLQQQSQYITAAMNQTQQILSQYQNLLHQYNLIRNGQAQGQNIIDRLIYSINPNYAGIGNLLAASTALNWNIAASANYGNNIKLASILNGLMMQNNRAGKQQLPTPKKQWTSVTNQTMHSR